MYNLGINSNYDSSFNPQKSMQMVKAAGFDSVMIAFKKGNVEELIKAAKSAGLNIPFAHLSYKNINAIWVKGVENRNVINSLKNELKLCHKYGITMAIAHFVSGGSFEYALKPNSQGISSICEVLDYAKSLNIKIAVENLDNLNKDHFFYILDNIKDENLGFCYDAGHHNLYLKDYDLLKMYGNRLMAVHLHDNFMNWEFGIDWLQDKHILPFDGKIDYDSVMENLAEQNFDGTVMLEVHKLTADKSPSIYDNLSEQEFLNEAHSRASKLAKMLEKNKEKK